jgi:hypothetical protein
LTTRQIDEEIDEALKFKPALKAFYILTTAPDDAALQDHVRKVNEKHEKQNLFSVVLLGWTEIIRRVSLYPQVADKHFAFSGGSVPSSPLLATWMMSKGKLLKTGDEFEICVHELIQDLHDWPHGHVVIRQRESDDLLERLRAFEGRSLSLRDRKERIRLREELRVLSDAEKNAERAIRLMLTEPEVSVWLLKIWEDGVSLAIEGFVNNHLRPWRDHSHACDLYLRMSPPGDSERTCSACLSRKDVSSIMDIMRKRQAMYGKTLTDKVGDLPSDIRSRVAVPRIIRGILEFLDEDRLTWNQIRGMRALSIGDWTIEMA